MEPGGPASGTGAAFTFTMTVSSTTHRSSVAVTKYCVVTVGFATGLGMEVLLSPIEGDQLYTVAFETRSNCVDVPSQMVASVCFVNVRLLPKPTTAGNVVVHPRLSFTVTV